MSSTREMHCNWGSLFQLFGHYNLVYLDPMVCELTSHEPWFSRLISWRQEVEKGSAAGLLRQITEALETDSGRENLSSFLNKGRLGPTPRAERSLQKRVMDVIDRHLSEPKRHHYSSVESWQKDKVHLKDVADKAEGASLIIVDGMFTRRVNAPDETRRSLDTRFPEEHSQQRRSFEGILTDCPPPLVTLNEPAIGLMVDRVAFYYRVGAVLTRSDWYPFTRTVGLYETSQDGQGFVDVIAILAGPHPTMDEVLAPSSPGRPWSLLDHLTRVQKDALDKEISELAKAASAPEKLYAKDGQFLNPIYMFLICCRLNGVDWTALQMRAPYAAHVFGEYMERLKELRSLLNELKMVSRIISQETDVAKLLPEAQDLGLEVQWLR
jgi:hypothetical protein